MPHETRYLMYEFSSVDLRTGSHVTHKITYPEPEDEQRKFIIYRSVIKDLGRKGYDNIMLESTMSKDGLEYYSSN